MVLVINFGSQYTELLARKTRKLGIFAEIINCDADDLISEAKKYEALILGGSPHTAKDELHEEIFKNLMQLQKPMLCICYGMQVMHKVCGGKIVYEEASEFGNTEINICQKHPIVDGIPSTFKTWMSHYDSVTKLAPGFVAIANTESNYSIAVDNDRRIYTLQFHPEVEHSPYGEKIIGNFLFLICQLKKNWKISNLVNIKVEWIKQQAKEERIYLALSGGVDSSVVAQLLKKSKANAKYIFVDTGLLYPQRLKPIMDYFHKELEDNLVIVDAKERFLKKLKGITDPEQKRKIVGSTFIEIFKEEIQKMGGGRLLAQGTIHSDLIESGKKTQSHTIKTHHNTVEDLHKNFTLLEPISDLFKDEVRQLGLEIGIPSFIVNTQPFPGPGYSIRIIGEVTEHKIEILRKADSIIEEELTKSKLYENISQCFAVILNEKTVGVSGDQRKYGYIVAIRAVDSQNMMTAKPSQIPIEILMEISSKIINKIPEITRVVYDLTSKPPATIEWE